MGAVECLVTDDAVLHVVPRGIQCVRRRSSWGFVVFGGASEGIVSEVGLMLVGVVVRNLVWWIWPPTQSIVNNQRLTFNSNSK